MYCQYCTPADFAVADNFGGSMPASCTGDDYNAAFGLFGNYTLMQNLIDNNLYDYWTVAGRGLGTDSIL